MNLAFKLTVDSFLNLFNNYFLHFLIIILVFGLLFWLLLFCHNKYIRKLYLAYFIFALIVLIKKYYIVFVKLFDSIFTSIIKYMFFPSMSEFLVTFMLTLFVLFFTVYRDKNPKLIKIINCAFANLIMACGCSFILVSVIKDVSVFSVNDIYLDSELLLLIEGVSILFVIWMVVLFVIKIVLLIRLKFNDNSKGIELL